MFNGLNEGDRYNSRNDLQKKIDELTKSLEDEVPDADSLSGLVLTQIRELLEKIKNIGQEDITNPDEITTHVDSLLTLVSSIGFENRSGVRAELEVTRGEFLSFAGVLADSLRKNEPAEGSWSNQTTEYTFEATKLQAYYTYLRLQQLRSALIRLP